MDRLNQRFLAWANTTSGNRLWWIPFTLSAILLLFTLFLFFPLVSLNEGARHWSGQINDQHQFVLWHLIALEEKDMGTFRFMAQLSGVIFAPAGVITLVPSLWLALGRQYRAGSWQRV